MREILFRGMDTKGFWHYGLLAHIGNYWFISNSVGVPTAYEVLPETIGQYIGLIDNSSKKIFEGDIIRGYGGEQCQGHWEYDETFTIFDIKNTRGAEYFENIDIIGNIFVELEKENSGNWRPSPSGEGNSKLKR